VARLIQRQSEDVFLVDHGSLYVALQRLEDKKWIRAKWGVSENNRKARFYSLTPKGREQLVEKTGEWRRLTRAMGLILDASADCRARRHEHVQAQAKCGRFCGGDQGASGA
jgi:PadR family transcriptional regulator PadR